MQCGCVVETTCVCQIRTALFDGIGCQVEGEKVSTPRVTQCGLSRLQGSLILQLLMTVSGDGACVHDRSRC